MATDPMITVHDLYAALELMWRGAPDGGAMTAKRGLCMADRRELEALLGGALPKTTEDSLLALIRQGQEEW